jgi:hypothetical protein
MGVPSMVASSLFAGPNRELVPAPRTIPPTDSVLFGFTSTPVDFL